MLKHRRHDITRWVLNGAIPLLVGILSISVCPSQTTSPALKDSDGDGFLDGPDQLIHMKETLVWRIGEDKNGNGKYEPSGQDQILGTQDDETAPNDPNSRPGGDAIVDYQTAAESHDADDDGLLDGQEDLNLNGIRDTGETDFQDADTDDDGLSDGFERGRALDSKLPFWNASGNLDPLNPDSDNDGLPDGLELGVTVEIVNEIPKTLAGGTWTRNGIIPPSNPYVDGKYTDTNATFLYNGTETKNCFIADEDPESITDPIRKDSNFDGTEDGVQDANTNGKRDIGEVDASEGWNSFIYSGTPDELFVFPYEIEPVIYNGQWNGNKKDSNKVSFLYQSSINDDFSESSISRIDVGLSLPSSINVNISRFIPEKRIWKIDLIINSDHNFETSQIENIHITNSSTEEHLLQLKINDPIVFDYINNNICGFSDYNSVPNFLDMPINEICWYSVSPSPLREHWKDPLFSVALGSNNLSALSLLAWNPVSTPTELSARETQLRRLLIDYFGVQATENYDGDLNNTEMIKYIERQWVLAMVFTEASGYSTIAKSNLQYIYEDLNQNDLTLLTANNIIEYQRQLLLTAITPSSHFAYVSSRPRSYGSYVSQDKNGNERITYRWCRKRFGRTAFERRNQVNGIRLFDCLDTPFYGSTARKYSGQKPIRADGNIVENLKWVNLMDFISEADHENNYEPQWKMKSLDSMIIAPTSIEDLSRPSILFSESNVPTRETFVRNLYRCAIMVMMAIEGDTSVFFDKQQPTAKYLDNIYSRVSDSCPNKRPCVDLGDPIGNENSRFYRGLLADGLEYLGDSEECITPHRDPYKLVYKQYFMRFTYAKFN